MTYFAVCSAVSIFLCNSYATNNSKLVGKNEITLNDTEELRTLENEIDKKFRKKYPDLFECFYDCAEYNIDPFRVKQIRDYVMGLSPDFVKIQCLEENIDIDRYKRGWAEICSILSEFDNEIDINLSGSLDASCLWDTIYKKDNYGNFEMDLINQYERGDFGDYCTIDRYYLCYCYSLAKRLYILAEKVFKDKKNKDFCTYIEATQVLIALVLH